MDPLSIAAFAAAGAKVLILSATQLESFRRATNDIDSSVEALQALSRGLARVLEDLGKALKNPVLSSEDNTDLWIGVHEEIESCKATADEIDRKLAPLKGVGANYALQAWRTFRLQFNQPDIDRLVSNMGTHSTNLQLSLQTVTVVIAASIPGAIDALLAARFERMVDTLGLYLDPVPGSERLEARRKGSRALPIDQNTAKLYLSAKSIFAGSVGGTVRSSASDAHIELVLREQPVFEDFALVLANPPTAMPEADYRLNERSRATIHDWIDHSPDPQVAEHASVSRVTESDESSDEDLDDGLALKFATSSFKRGMDSYNEERFSEAREYLKIGIEQARSLSDEHKGQLDLPSMQFHHALSCIVESSLPEAESSFRLVIEGTGNLETDARLRCFALYHLARVQLRIGKHDSAKRYCRKAVRQMGAEPSIGETHTAHVDALRLLALIVWAKGEKSTARVYSDLLPLERRITEGAFDTELALLIESIDAQSSATETQTASVGAIIPQAPILEEPPRAKSLSVSERHIPMRRPISQSSAFGGSVTTDLTSPISITSTEASSLATGDSSGAYRTINSKKFHGKSGVIKGLCWAAEQGRLDILNILIENQHADVDAHKSGMISAHDTPLMIAALNGHPAICKRLLEADAIPNLVSRHKTALNCAIQANQINISRLLLESGASQDWLEHQDLSPLGTAVLRSNLPMCQMLLDSGADVNETYMFITTKRRTALMQAASVDNVEVMKWLLERGASPNGPSSTISTPLIEAARLYAIAACRLLLDEGADPKLQTSAGKTASRVTGGWLRKFIDDWPASRSRKTPEYTMTLQSAY